MKAICSIVVIAGCLLMLMSSATLAGLDKAKIRKSKSVGKERLTTLPVRFMRVEAVT